MNCLSLTFVKLLRTVIIINYTQGHICASFSRLGPRLVPSSAGWDTKNWCQLLQAGTTVSAILVLEICGIHVTFQTCQANKNFQISSFLTYFFISFFACERLMMFVISSGAIFHKCIASLMHVFWVIIDFPISIGFPLVSALVETPVAKSFSHLPILSYICTIQLDDVPVRFFPWVKDLICYIPKFSCVIGFINPVVVEVNDFC